MDKEKNMNIPEETEDIKETPIEQIESTVEFENEPVVESMDDLGEKFNGSIGKLKKKGKTVRMSKHFNFLKAILIMFIAFVPLVSYIAYDEAIAQVDLEHKTMIDKLFEKKVPAELITEYQPTVLNVGYNKDAGTLIYDIEQASVKLDKYFINISKDTIDKWMNTELNVLADSFDEKTEQPHGKQFLVRSIDSYNNMLYVNYLNSTGTAARDIIISDFIMTSGLNINDMKSLDNKLYEYTDDTTVMSFIESYNDSFIFYSEAIAHGKLATKTLGNRLNDIDSSFRYTPVKDVTEENVIINFEGAGTLNLGKLTNFKGAPGIYLSTQDGVLRLYNYADDEAYVFVTYVNNDSFMCEASDLLNTNYDNLFVCDGFNDKESVGYRTFAIKGSGDQLYIFRVLEIADEKLVDEIFTAFGIEKDKIEVEVVQESVDIENVEGINDTGADSVLDAENSEVTENTEKDAEASEDNTVIEE